MRLSSQQRLLRSVAMGFSVTEEGALQLKGLPHGSYDNRGYRMFSAGGGGVAVHRLQAYQKYGDAIFALGAQVRHLDGNKLNNHKSNIATGTAHDNALDKPPEIRRAMALAALASRKPRTKRANCAWRRLHTPIPLDNPR